MAENGLPLAEKSSVANCADGRHVSATLLCPVGEDERAAMQAGAGNAELIFVKKYLHSRRALIFRLSNRTSQAFFFDGLQILVHNGGALATLTDASGQRYTWETEALFRAEVQLDASVRLRGLATTRLYFADCERLFDIVMIATRRLRYINNILQQSVVRGAGGTS